ncbi:MAG: hypothetical protein ACK5HP_03240 [Bacilli bacterium]
MKKIFISIVILLMYFITFNVQASSLNTFIVNSDALTYKNGDTVTLTIKMNSTSTINSENTFYYINYDTSIFTFKSFSGLNNVFFDSNEKKLYFNSNINVIQNDVIGTITLTINDDAVLATKNVEIPYYSFYKTKDNEDSIILTIEPVIELIDINEASLETTSDLTPYVVGSGIGIAVVSSLILIINLIKKY